MSLRSFFGVNCLVGTLCPFPEPLSKQRTFCGVVGISRFNEKFGVVGSLLV